MIKFVTTNIIRNDYNNNCKQQTHNKVTTDYKKRKKKNMKELKKTLDTTNNNVKEFFTQFGEVTYPNVSRNGYTQTIAINANDGIMSRVQVWESETSDRIDIYVGVLTNVYKIFSSFGHLNNKRSKRELKEICINMSYDSLVTLIDIYNRINTSWTVETLKADTKKTTKKTTTKKNTKKKEEQSA